MKNDSSRYAVVKIACIARALQRQKEPENTTTYKADKNYWLAFNEAIDISIRECNTVIKDIEDFE